MVSRYGNLSILAADCAIFMKELFQKPLFRWILFGVVILATGIRTFVHVNDPERHTNGYDEQMWTSASVTSYYMFFKGHLRPTEELDNWFPSYAYRFGLDIFKDQITVVGTNGATFTGNKVFFNEYINADSVRFPQDIISFDTLKSKYGAVIEYDTLKFPHERYQWFDRAIWTFGWKAPNWGKYVMGWWLDNFGPVKPDPNGYFQFYQPLNQVDTSSKEYVPSQVRTGAPFSYAPPEMIRSARIPNALLTIGIVALVFLGGWYIFGFWQGLIAGLWMFLNKTFLMINSAVGLDSFSTFYTTAAILLLVLVIQSLYKNTAWWKTLLYALALAVSIGLAVSSKLNSGVLVFISIAIFVPVGLLLLWDVLKNRNAKAASATGKTSVPGWIKIGTLLGAGVITGLVSTWLFIYLNPQVQGDPRKSIKVMQHSIDDYFTERAPKITLQETREGKKTYKWVDIKKDWGKSFALTMKRIAVVDFEKENLDKSYYGTFGSLLKFNYNFLDGLFAFLGLGVVVLLTFRGVVKKKQVVPATIFLVAFLIIFYGNVDFLWQDWPRYFTPLFPLYSILIGVGLYESVNWIIRRMGKKENAPAAKVKKK